MGNVDFMLCQLRRRLTNINPALSIPQRRHGRSTLAQCFPNVGHMSQAIYQRVHGNPQSEMMSQHQTKSGCYNHCANAAGIFVLHKSKCTITQMKNAYPMLLLCWADIV